MKIFSFLGALAVALLAGCGPSASGPAPFSETFGMRFASVPFSARIALEPSERARGLMGAASLPENEGMIFVNEIPCQASFWMKNVPIPLDIAFIDPEGRILQVRRMFPHDETPVKSSSQNVLYCVEMNAGWFEKNGLKSGDRLDMDLFLKALGARRGE